MDKNSWEFSQVGKEENRNGMALDFKDMRYGKEFDSDDERNPIKKAYSQKKSAKTRKEKRKLRDKKFIKPRDIKIMVWLNNKQLLNLNRMEDKKQKQANCKRVDLADYFYFDPLTAFEIQQNVIKEQYQMIIEAQKEIQDCQEKMKEIYLKSFQLKKKPRSYAGGQNGAIVVENLDTADENLTK